MKNLKFFLFGLVFVLTQFTIFAQDEITNTETTNVKEETEKWQFIEKYFTSDLNPSKLQKVGLSLNNYSSYIAVPTTCRLLWFPDNIFTKLNIPIINAINEIFYKNLNINIANYTEFSLTILESIIVFLITNKVLQAIGKRLENEDERCLQLLTDFVNGWKENKEQTPASLIPMFETLTTDDNISRKPLQKTIDKALAKKVVAAIIATSLMIDSASNSRK